MEAVCLSNVFKSLFSHRTCSRLRYHPVSATRSAQFADGRRFYRMSKQEKLVQEEKNSSRWQQRTDFFQPDKLKEYQEAPLVTSGVLRSNRERPRNVRMLTRDFIEDSLYNPNYGYFPKEAVIFSPGQPFDFNAMKDDTDFHGQLGRRYTDFEDELDSATFNEARQLWHTPTELFKPFYGEAVARYLVENYKLTHHPFRDLTIYELGAGNGTLMLNILDFIRDFHPEIYERTKFKVIEISSALADLQNQHLVQTADSRGHADKVEIINRSIFAWNTFVPAPCYFLALEVFDNFAHDSIRYRPEDETPLQGSVLIDDDGNFYEFYTPDIDPLASRFLRVRRAACSKSFRHPLEDRPWLRKLKFNMPLAPNLTEPEYIPTRLLQFFDILHRYFPYHQLLTADFDRLPGAIKGYNAPAVQTRFQRKTIPVTTTYNLQGYFDILFPTDFEVMEDLYRAVTGKLTKTMSQAEWLRRWAELEDTQCKNGENPMLSWYENSSVMLSI